MMEEFIDDIVNSDAEPKTEAEITTEIQASDADKNLEQKGETTDNKVKMGSEATPTVAQPNEDGSSAVNVDTDSDAIKELAAQLGWNEDHKGDDAVDAKTYILRSKDIQKSMSQHNKDLKNQLQALSDSVSALKKHNENVYQAEVKKLTDEITALKAERRAAVELADVDKVDELDEKIEQKQKDINAPKPNDGQELTKNVNPIYDEWIKDNDWYLKDNDMAKFADTVAQQYIGAPLDRIYTIVRNKVQEVFPDKFEEVKKVDKNKVTDSVKTPIGPKSPVERSSAKVDESSFTKADLTSDQLQIMRQFVQGGIMTEEQYIKDIAKMQ